MTAPIHRLLSTEDTLSCETCEPAHSETGAELETPVLGWADRYESTLTPADFLRIAPRPTPRLLDLVWRRSSTLAPEILRGIPATLLLRQPVPVLSEAYIRSEPLAFVDFLPALVEFFNRVQRLDLDFYNIPVNRGIAGCRFSEYSPRSERSHDCNLRVEAHTSARAHGEIRPVAGMDESLITRLSVDFRPNIMNGVPNFPDLEIDGFAGIDPPLMTFDRRFLGRHRESVLGVSGGDASYENPLAAGEPLASDWDSIAPAPPGGHRYWMFNFTAVVDSLYALAAREIGTRQMMLWAYLPTAGLTDPALYEAIGVPYNTFPRRFGDVLQLLSPLFSRASREAVRRAAPYYNPNTEYLDLEGNRRAIPDDATELARINAEREAYNRAHPSEEPLPPLRNRGPVLDWVFTDLLSDASRLTELLGLDPDAWPSITSRFQAGATDLSLPWGTLHVGPETEVQLRYALEPVRDADTGDVSGRLHARVSLDPLVLQNIDLEISGVRVRARELRAANVVAEIPSLLALFQSGLSPELALNLALENVELTGLEVADRRSGVSASLESAQLGRLHLNYHGGAWHVEVGGEGEGSGWTSRGLEVSTAYGQVQVEAAEIPNIDVRYTRSGPRGARRLSVEIPTVHSRGELAFSYFPRASTVPLQIHLEGESTLSDLRYYYTPEGETRHQARAGFAGGVRMARIEHESFGALEFSTLHPDRETDPEAMHGTFQFRLLPPNGSEERGGMETSIALDLPFVAMGAHGSFLDIPRETSTLEDGHLRFSNGSLTLEGNLDISGARLHGLGNGPTELGNYVISAEAMDIHDIWARGPARFEFNPSGWRLSHRDDSETRLGIGMLVENLGLAHQPEESGLPRGRARRVASEVVRTEVRLEHAEVEVEDLRFLEYQRVETLAGRRGRLTRIESGAITAHHLRGGGAIWAPLPIWGFVRGLFPFLGTTSGERPPSRPDTGALLEHLSSEARCALGEEDFMRIGGVEFRLYPLSAESRTRRERESLGEAAPRGDWVARLTDIILNLHEAEVPEAGASRRQFALIRVPSFEAGRRWETRPEESTCRAAREADAGAVCGEELSSWSLSPDYWAHLYLNDPQRGGSFLFQRWPAPDAHATLAELLRECPAP